ncbi:hypothetical protein [Haloactinospora alba]|nr:hypothetical protein [Haloactinospora alba]
MAGTGRRARFGASVLLAVLAASTGCSSGNSEGTDGEEPPRLDPEAVYLSWQVPKGGLPDGEPLDIADDARLVGATDDVRLHGVRKVREMSQPVEGEPPPGEETVSPDTTMPSAGGRAAPEHELLLARIETDDKGVYPKLFEPTRELNKRELFLRVGDAKRPLPDEAFSSGQKTGPVVLTASVPTGKPVALVMESEGREQSLDLRTGERGEDAVREFYRAPLVGPRKAVTWPVDVRVKLRDSPGYPPLSDPVTVTMPSLPEEKKGEKGYRGAARGFWLSVYAPEHDWAPEGKRWLLFESPSVSDSGNGSDYNYYADEAATYTVEADGKTYEPRESKHSIEAVLVPESFRSGTLRITPQGKARLAPDALKPQEAEVTETIDGPVDRSTVPIRISRL